MHAAYFREFNEESKQPDFLYMIEWTSYRSERQAQAVSSKVAAAAVHVDGTTRSSKRDKVSIFRAAVVEMSVQKPFVSQ
jgi:tagatose-1,6-bisphosphate aldolase